MELNNQPIEQSAPDKKALLEFLGKEIDHIQAEFARPGWTNWAIIGGIATTAWLLYSEIELGSFDVNRILTLWLIFSLVFPFISMVFLRFLIKLPFTPYLANDRFYYSLDSTVKCNRGLEEYFKWRFEVKAFSGSMIELIHGQLCFGRVNL